MHRGRGKDLFEKEPSMQEALAQLDPKELGEMNLILNPHQYTREVMFCMMVIVFGERFKNNWIHVKQKLKDCERVIEFFKIYHGTPTAWQLEMTKKIRTAKWFTYQEIRSVNK